MPDPRLAVTSIPIDVFQSGATVRCVSLNGKQYMAVNEFLSNITGSNVRYCAKMWARLDEDVKDELRPFLSTFTFSGALPASCMPGRQFGSLKISDVSDLCLVFCRQRQLDKLFGYHLQRSPHPDNAYRRQERQQTSWKNGGNLESLLCRRQLAFSRHRVQCCVRLPDRGDGAGLHPEGSNPTGRESSTCAGGSTG